MLLLVCSSGRKLLMHLDCLIYISTNQNHALFHALRERSSALGAEEGIFLSDTASSASIDHSAWIEFHDSAHSLDAQKAFFASSLRKCARSQGLLDGRGIHHGILHSELAKNLFLSNLLVQMYGICGALSDCCNIFSHMCVRDQFSWNFLMGAFDQNNICEHAIFVFEFMLREGCLPDKHIYASVLSACARINDIVHGIQMHARIIVCGMASDAVVGGNLVNVYGRCGFIMDAENIFSNLHECNPMAWTSLMTTYIEHGSSEDVIKLFVRMQQESTPLDRVLFISVLSACAHTVALTEGRRIHEFVLETGFIAELEVANTLINMYGKCGRAKDALDVLAGIQERDLVSWSSMIAAFAQCEESLNAWNTFCQMLQEAIAPNRVTFINILTAFADQKLVFIGKQLHAALFCQGYEPDALLSTSLINMYKNCGDPGNALFVYSNLAARDEAANVSILSVCATYGAIKDGGEAHTFVTLTGMDLESNVCISLVNMYGKCGSLEEAQRAFETAFKHDVVLWNAMAAAYSQNGQGMAVINLLQRMQAEDVHMNKATYSTLLTACSHAGLVDAACCYFIAINKSEMKPETDQFNCMMDLLARTGRMDKAMELVSSMPLKPTVVSWLTLLTLCQTNIDLKLGECTAEHVIELEPEETGPYVILANICCHESSSKFN